jgi:hypothetical protein
MTHLKEEPSVRTLAALLMNPPQRIKNSKVTEIHWPMTPQSSAAKQNFCAGKLRSGQAAKQQS